MDRKKAYIELIRMGGETSEEWKGHISLTWAGMPANADTLKCYYNRGFVIYVGNKESRTF
jgi:hypothetical protein